jgi:hypothetical protein
MNETTKVIRFYKTGGPDVLRVEDVRWPQPLENEVLIRVQALASMGFAALQMVKAVGAKSIAVTRSEGKQEGLLAAGADQVLIAGREDIPLARAPCAGSKCTPVSGFSILRDTQRWDFRQGPRRLSVPSASFLMVWRRAAFRRRSIGSLSDWMNTARHTATCKRMRGSERS